MFMCGRFINLTRTNSLKKKFNIINPLNKDIISYNIAPSQNFFIIFKKKNTINISEASWGYEFFDKKKNLKKNVINSRLETLNNKIFFKESYLERKCLIPVNGYYEWCLIDKKKIPFFIHIPPSEPMYLAGIWKYINFKINDNKVFTILTKIANKNLIKIHNRMPIVLSAEESDEYLNDDSSSFLKSSFVSDIEIELDSYPVSKFVNNPLNNSKECIKPI